MQLKDESLRTEWNAIVERNGHDGYSKATIDYAIRLAEMLEAEMAKGGKLAEVAKKTTHDADTEGITGAMYGMAISALSQYWKHGEELRKWHNADWGSPDVQGVVNPAVITVGIPDNRRDEPSPKEA